MDYKEIKFYLKFHKGFRKNYNLNSARKSNLLLLNNERFLGLSKIGQY